MNVDRIARAMMAGWRRSPSGPASGPRPDFTAYVMAPIHGRPRPDFTARVMSRLDEAASAHDRRRAWLIATPAALALLGAVIVFRSPAAIVPDVPHAPRITPGMFEPRAIPTFTAVMDRPATKSRRPAPVRTIAAGAAAAAPDETMIYVIPALDGPASLTMKPIEPAAFTIPALEGPAPLKVTDLPGAPGGSRDQNFKEKP